MLNQMEIEEIVRALPKVEQHVHIRGSTRPETLLWIIDDSGTDSPFKTVEDIRGFFRFRDFHFIQVYSAVDDLISKEQLG